MSPEPKLDVPPDPEAPPADPEPAASPPSAPRPGVPPVVVPRWVQLVLLPVALLGLYAAAKAAGPVLLIFIVASVIALVLNPLVRLVERSGIPHSLCVVAVYLGLLVALACIVVLLINPVTTQIQRLQDDVPHLTHQANRRLADLQTYLDRHNINIHVKKQGQTALETLQKSFLRRSGDIVSFTRDLVQKLVTGAFALILVIVVSIYMLVYGQGIGRLTRRVMPPGDGTPEDDFPLRVEKAVSSYVRGQLLFSLIMGTTAGVALWIFGVIGIFPDGRTYALFFGAFFGLMELVPYVGPVLGALPPILVALFQDPLTALWLVLLFVALQQLEGHVVAPQVFGHTLRINPILIIFALLFGAEVYGVVGAFVALPLAAVARETVVYLRKHLVLEEWGAVPPSAVVAPRPELEAGRPGESLRSPSPAPCPACGAAVRAHDRYCPRCGTELGDDGE
jgi:predicted PurR-regulated permease PerM